MLRWWGGGCGEMEEREKGDWRKHGGDSGMQW